MESTFRFIGVNAFKGINIPEGMKVTLYNDNDILDTYYGPLKSEDMPMKGMMIEVGVDDRVDDTVAEET